MGLCIDMLLVHRHVRDCVSMGHIGAHVQRGQGCRQTRQGSVLCTHVCTDMWLDPHTVDTCTDTYADMPIVCAGMCVYGSWIRRMHRHVYGHVYRLRCRQSWRHADGGVSAQVHGHACACGHMNASSHV